MDEVERVARLIKPLKEVVQLSSWMTHVTFVLGKIPNLKNERELLEVCIGEKILDDEMKRLFPKRE